MLRPLLDRGVALVAARPLPTKTSARAEFARLRREVVGTDLWLLSQVHRFVGLEPAVKIFVEIIESNTVNVL